MVGKRSVKEQLDKHRSIARHIIEGTITIDDVAEFERMLQVIPDNPALHAAFGDLLVKKGMQKKAATSYDKAASLYQESDLMLSAILAKIMQWRLAKPSHRDARDFFTVLGEGNFPASPLRTFFKSLTYAEVVAFTNRMARVSLPTNKVIKKIGDVEDALYLIASGAVRETIYKHQREGQKERQKYSVYLTVNDIFGDIYPFEEQKLSKSYIETVSGVELARISKGRLVEVCSKYPNVARSLVVLFKTSLKSAREDPDRGIRRTNRHPLPIKMDLEVFPEGSEDSPLVLKGYSRDISVGGVCIVVDAKYTNITRLLQSLTNAEVQVCFPTESMKLNVLGNIVWSRKVSFEGENTLALGVQFKDMTPRMSGMLVVFADMIYNS
jgi:hypothetical protein